MTKKRVWCKNMHGCILAIALAIFLFQTIFLFSGIFPGSKTLVANIIIASMSLLAFISVTILYFNFPKNFPYEKKAKLFLTISMFLFFIGDFIWLLDENFLNITVFLVELPNFFWNAAYIMLAISLIFFIKIEFRERKSLYILLGISAMISAVGLYLTSGNYFSNGTLILSELIEHLYPVYNLFLFMMVLYLLYPLIKSGNKLFLGWIFLGAGIITRIIYDTILVLMPGSKLSQVGNPIDLIYVSLYLFVILNNLMKSRLRFKND